MAEALYGPAGYYTLRPRLGGAGRDYYTAPELHPAFGALLGRQLAEVWQALDRPNPFQIVEHGPGTGSLCRDLLSSAEHDAPAFAATLHYHLLEASPTLRDAQRETLANAGLVDARVTWDTPTTVTGCILANELLDALPVHLVTVQDGRLLERYVTLQQDRPTFVDGPASTPALERYFADLGLLPGEGCVAEVNLQAITWAHSAAATLARGALIVLDYGYDAAELYAPKRRHGTLLCYRDHTLSSDPFARVGEQDITAHVDFTTLTRAGERAGLQTLGRIDQAAFLRNLGLRDYLRQLERAPIAATEHDANRRALAELARPDGLGAIQVLIQARALDHIHPSGLVGRPDAANTPWLPLLHPTQMRLPGPLEAEGFADLEAQWRDFWTGHDSDD